MLSRQYIKVILIGLISGLVNGLFGSGGGTIVVPALIFIIGLEEHKAHATAISIILPLTIVSTFIYFQKGALNFDIALYVASGGILGGILGSKLLNKVPSNLLRKGFGLVMILAALRMVMK